jgi:Tfp pilus assembly PilM family ATPase
MRHTGVLLKKKMEDNSTQKLLNLIRTGEQESVTDEVLEYSESSLPVTTKIKDLNLGVLITSRDLTLVMTSGKGGSKKKHLVKWQNILLPEHLQPDSPEFSDFLGNCLDHFLGDKKKISIWCALASTSLKIRNITIPDLPQSKIANAAFWALKKETEFNETAEIFNFEILGDVTIDGIKKKNILVFSAPRDDIHALEKIFEQAGYSLAGMTSIPFAMQNFIRTGQIRVEEPYFALVNISREMSEIYCFSPSGILLVRTIRSGSWSLVEELDGPMDMDPIEFLSSLTKTGSDGFLQIKETSDRLIGKIMRTGEYCSQNYTGNKPIKRYVFYGETDFCEPFMYQASSIISAAVETFNPFTDSLPGSNEVELPQNATQRNSVLTAFGIALSANEITPNFFFTFDDWQKLKKQRKITLATAIVGMILLGAVFLVHFQLKSTHQKDLATLAQLSREQATFSHGVQKETIAAVIALTEQKLMSKTQYLTGYLPLAVIDDICHFTPDHIQMTALVYDHKRDKKIPDKVSKIVSMEGRVLAHPYRLDSELDNYILKLSESPVFGDIEIIDKRLNTDEKNNRLLFRVMLEVL